MKRWTFISYYSLYNSDSAWFFDCWIIFELLRFASIDKWQLKIWQNSNINLKNGSIKWNFNAIHPGRRENIHYTMVYSKENQNFLSWSLPKKKHFPFPQVHFIFIFKKETIIFTYFYSRQSGKSNKKYECCFFCAETRLQINDNQNKTHNKCSLLQVNIP